MSIAENASTQGIPTEIYYPLPLPPATGVRLPCYQRVAFSGSWERRFPGAGIARPPPMKEQMEIARALLRFRHN